MKARRDALVAAGTAAFGALLLLPLALHSFGGWQDQDFYWHTRMGQDWLRHALPPYRDHYSFTYAGAPILLPPAGFQALLAACQLALGDLAGSQALSFALRAGTLLALFWISLRRLRASPWIAGPALALAAYALSLRSYIRPEIASYPLGLLAAWLATRERERPSIGFRAGAALLLAAWSNVHVTAALGFVAFGAFYAGRVLTLLGERPRRWSRIATEAAWGGATFAAGFANPSLAHPVLFLLRADPRWNPLISEHSSTSLLARSVAEYAYWIVLAVALPLLARRRRWCELLIASVLLFQELQLQKMFTYLVLMTLPSVVELLEDLRRRGTLARLRPAVRVAVAATGALAGAALYGEALANAPTARFDEAQQAASYPARIVAYMRERGLKGRVLNSHAVGGFLVYAGAPDLQVYIDGRTNILYPLRHMQEFVQVTGNPAVARAVAERYDIPFAIAETWGPRGILLNSLVLSGAFEIEVEAAGFALLRRPGTAYPAATRIYARPQCYSGRLVPRLRAELRRAQAELEKTSDFYGALAMAVDFAGAADPREYLRNPAIVPFGDDRLLRLAGSLAVDAKAPDLAAGFLEAIATRYPEDDLLLAEQELALGRKADAAARLASLFREQLMGRRTDLDREADRLLSLLERVAAAGGPSPLAASELGALSAARDRNRRRIAASPLGIDPIEELCLPREAR